MPRPLRPQASSKSRSQPSPSTAAGISWADKESKEWRNQEVWKKDPVQGYFGSMIDPGSTLTPGPSPAETPEERKSEEPEPNKEVAKEAAPRDAAAPTLGDKLASFLDGFKS